MRFFTLSPWAALTFSTSSLAIVLDTQERKDYAAQADRNGSPAGEGVELLDGVPISQISGTDGGFDTPFSRAAVPAGAVPLAAAGWTATADSFEPGYPASNAIDNNANTFWHTPFGAAGNALPHYITVDMKQVQLINSLSMQPRQDGKANGNIGAHTITTSKDCVTFYPPFVLGTWRDDQTTKVSLFEAHNARCVRITATTEAGNRGPWSSVAEIQIYTTNNPAPPYKGVGGGKWSPSIDFPIVPVAAVLEYNSGNLNTWSAYSADQFGGSAGVSTLTATYYPGSQTVGQRVITNTKHDMFCPGINVDKDGRVIVTGGNTSPKTSIFLPTSRDWAAGPNTQIPRGYASQTTTSDGRTFLIGGSWSGGQGGKDGEIYASGPNTWTKLPGCPVAPMLTKDPADQRNNEIYRSDNHAMLFGWKNGWVFQAGPSKAMNWYNTNGNGGYKGAGNRGNDGDAMCGIAVMYDAVAGKILVTGGSPAYQDQDSTANAHVITIGAEAQNPGVQTINPMWYKRIFHNGVVLPNGDVMIVGGQVYGAPFSDATSQLIPELWQAGTTNFIKLPPINAPRNYHSIAILLADATVFVGGGGLCGTCNTNHFDGQVYYPGYLFNPGDGNRAVRPVINTATGQVGKGGTITATTNGAIAAWSLVRVSSTTHTVNTDQRRVPLTATNNGNTYALKVPNDYGIVLPGYYMLFGMNAQGTPSLSKSVKIV